MKFFLRKLSWLFVALLSSALYLYAPFTAQALSWSKIVTNGIDKANNITVVDIVTFNGQLYASLGNVVTGAGIYRSTNGTSWSQINTGGFGNTGYTHTRLAVLGSTLYAGTADMPGLGDSCQLWKSTNGTTWTQVDVNGFGDTNNMFIGDLQAWEGDLYVGTFNPVTGTEVFKVTSSDTVDTVTQVNTDGFGSILNWDAFEFGVFNDSLYAGVENLTSGAQIWSTSDGTTWAQTNTSGFGVDTNYAITSMFNFNGYFFAGTANNISGCQLWRTNNGTNWSMVNDDGFGNANNIYCGLNVTVVNNVAYLGTRNDNDGALLLYSSNGTTWTEEGSRGFGDTNNFAFYATTYNGYLYLGASNNTTGAQIWRTGDIDPLAITTDSVPEGTINSEYTETTMGTENGTTPLSWSQSGDLPDGITFDLTKASFSGTPKETGEFNVVITVTDSGTPTQLASRNYTLKINEEVLPETGADISLIYSRLMPRTILFR